VAVRPALLQVEVNTTCNLRCGICPCTATAHTRPAANLAVDDYRAAVERSFLPPYVTIFSGFAETLLHPQLHRLVEFEKRRGGTVMVATNGTLLDEKAAARLLDSPLEHITLSFDGATKESFEFYRKGARFETVRDNFLRFARMKAERRRKLQIVVQMVRLPGNAGEVDDFVRFWTAAPGVDQVRVKEDETNLIRPSAGHAPSDWRHPCHYLWRGPLYVKHNGDVYPCCQSYMLGGRPVGRIGEAPLETIWNSGEMERMRRLHVEGRAGEIDICARCCTTIPHPALVLGSLLLHGRTVRRLLPAVERLVYLSKLPRKLLRPPKA
jgi:radical SAM protein with 4Fe4S-binding SPASM domain